MQYFLYTILFDSCEVDCTWNILCTFKNIFFFSGGAAPTAVIRVAEETERAREQSATTAAGTDSGSGQRKRQTFSISGQPDQPLTLHPLALLGLETIILCQVKCGSTCCFVFALCVF